MLYFAYFALLAVQAETPDAEQILYKSRAVLEAPVIYVTKSGKATSRFYLGAPKDNGEFPIRIEKSEGLIDVAIVALSESEMFEVFDEHSVAIDMSWTQNLIKKTRSPDAMRTKPLTKTSVTNASLHEVVEEDGEKLYVVDNLLAHSEGWLNENPDALRGHRTWIRASDFHPVRFGYLQGDGSVSPITEYTEIQPRADIADDMFEIPKEYEVVKPTTIAEYALMKRQVFRIGAGLDLFIPTSDIKAADAIARVEARGAKAMANIAALSERTQSANHPIDRKSTKSAGMKLFLVLNGLIIFCLAFVAMIRKWYWKAPDR